jgi:hypothetical protein
MGSIEHEVQENLLGDQQKNRDCENRKLGQDDIFNSMLSSMWAITKAGNY